MHYLRVRNWDEYQHYKKRNPPWIRLYHRLLDDYEYTSLPDAAKGHLLGILMLASRLDNRIPADARWIASKIGATEPVDLELLSHFLAEHEKPSANACVADRSHDASKTLVSRAPARSASASVSVSEGVGSRGGGMDHRVSTILREFEQLFGVTVSPGGFAYLEERFAQGGTIEQARAVMSHVCDSGIAVGTPNDVFAASTWRRALGQRVRERGPEGIQPNDPTAPVPCMWCEAKLAGEDEYDEHVRDEHPEEWADLQRRREQRARERREAAS